MCLSVLQRVVFVSCVLVCPDTRVLVCPDTRVLVCPDTCVLVCPDTRVLVCGLGDSCPAAETGKVRRFAPDGVEREHIEFGRHLHYDRSTRSKNKKAPYHVQLTGADTDT